MQLLFEFLFLIENFVNDYYFFSLIIFSIFIFIYALISFPAIAIVWLFSGYVFGIFIGYILAIIFTATGSLCLFLLSKNIFHSFFKSKFKGSIMKLENKIKNNSLEILILFRMFPINMPFFIQNVGLSFLNISYINFFISTLIGLTPLVLFAVIIGNNFTQFNELKSFNLDNLLSLNLLIPVFIIFIFLILRIILKNRKF
ncbi:MAG: hypothetical protein CFH20_00800 [Alphaproteobacteria bacterium MarineAlpha5_Bin10]|nr:MAG: hypothetical protein CFH20_00800 [Alphaproteobacteria bacterium MarineAlpha5_Bin10]